MLAKHKSFASSTKTTNRSYSKIKKNTKYSAKTNTKPAPETKPRVRQMLPRGFRKKTITASKTTLLFTAIFTAIRLNSPDGYNIEAKQVLRKKPARFQVDRSGTFELPNIPKIPVLLLTFVPPPPLTESILTDCRRLTEGE